GSGTRVEPGRDPAPPTPVSPGEFAVLIAQTDETAPAGAPSPPPPPPPGYYPPGGPPPGDFPPVGPLIPIPFPGGGGYRPQPDGPRPPGGHQEPGGTRQPPPSRTRPSQPG